MNATVVLVGTLDTTGDEYAFLRDRLRGAGVATLLVDVGTQQECAELGRRVGATLSTATGPVALFVPLRGISALAGEGGAFADPDADAALLAGLRETLTATVEVHEVDAHINDEIFAVATAARLDEFCGRTNMRGQL